MAKKKTSKIEKMANDTGVALYGTCGWTRIVVSKTILRYIVLHIAYFIIRIRIANRAHWIYCIVLRLFLVENRNYELARQCYFMTWHIWTVRKPFDCCLLFAGCGSGATATATVILFIFAFPSRNTSFCTPYLFA